jgi:hypothetical protein
VAAIGLNATPHHAIARRPKPFGSLEGFAKYFQTYAVPMPSYSKNTSAVLRNFKVGEGVFVSLDRSDLTSDDQMPASRPLFLAVPFPTLQ